MKYILLIVALLAWGCRNTHKAVTSSLEKGKEVCAIDFTVLNAEGLSDSMTYQELLPFSSLSDSIQVVKLQTEDHCLVDGRAKYLIGNDFILVAQKDQVMLFDREGRFRRVVARSGRAPGEFDRVDDMAVNEGIVYLLSEMGYVNIYSLSDSSYHKQLNVAGEDRFFNSVVALSGGCVLLAPSLYKDSKHLVFSIDTAGRFLTGINCPPNDYGLHYDGRKTIYKVGDEVFYVSRANDTIYHWVGEALETCYTFLTGKNQKMRFSGETPGSLFLTVWTLLEEKKEEGRALATYSNSFYRFDKEEKRLSKFGQVWDDHFLLCHSNVDELHLQNGEYFYRVYSAPMLDELIPQVLEFDDKDVKPGIKSRLKEFQKMLSVDDNPVLLVGKLK